MGAGAHEVNTGHVKFGGLTTQLEAGCSAQAALRSKPSSGPPPKERNFVRQKLNKVRKACEQRGLSPLPGVSRKPSTIGDRCTHYGAAITCGLCGIMNCQACSRFGQCRGTGSCATRRMGTPSASRKPRGPRRACPHGGGWTCQWCGCSCCQECICQTSPDWWHCKAYHRCIAGWTDGSLLWEEKILAETLDSMTNLGIEGRFSNGEWLRSSSAVTGLEARTILLRSKDVRKKAPWIEDFFGVGSVATTRASCVANTAMPPCANTTAARTTPR